MHTATKSFHPSSRKLNRSGILALIGALFATAPASLFAQYAVESITYGTAYNTADVVIDSLTYLNSSKPVTTVNVATLGGYTVSGALASNVYYRRGTTGGNQSAVLYQNVPGNTGQTYAKADSTPTLNEVMLSGDLSQSLWNPFNNVGTGAGATSSIERIDFFFNGGYVVQGDELIVLFDFENPGNTGDPFRIAAYTAIDGSNTPTSYVNSGLLVGAAANGTPPVPPPNGTNAQYIRSVTNFGDNLYNSSNLSSTNQTIAARDTNAGDSTELGLIGRAILLTDLGVTAGQTIYGYSLIAGDSLVTNAASLVNWLNTSVYLNNTTNATDEGNIDFVGFGAQFSRRVPEPSTYGMIFMGLLGGFFAWRRYRANLASSG